jgi:hypothetical protein
VADRRARREAAAFALAITVAVVMAPFLPEGTVLLTLLVAGAWAVTASGRRVYLRRVVARYHVPPFARVFDSLSGIVHHLRRGAAGDTLLSLGFFVTVAVPIVLLELVIKKSPDVKGTMALGLAVGVVIWHVVLEAFHQPRRRAEYDGRPDPEELPVWPLLVTLVVEVAVFAFLFRVDYLPEEPFVGGLLLGIAAMGLADAATLQSTLVAGALNGRPLRSGSPPPPRRSPSPPGSG